MTFIIGLLAIAYVVVLYVRHEIRKARREVELLKAQGWTIL